MEVKLQQIKAWITENALFVGTVGGVIVGLVLGFVFKPLNPSETVQQLVSYPGELYIRSLQMMIIPLVMCSLFAGAGSLDGKSNGRLVGLTFAYFLVTSLFNAALGATLAVTIRPGDTSMPNTTSSIGNPSFTMGLAQRSMLDSFMDIGRNLLPPNIFAALTTQTFTAFKEVDGGFERFLSTRDGTNMLGVIAVTLIFGFLARSLGEKGMKLIETAKTLESLFIKATNYIIWSTPISVASIVCGKILEVRDMWTIMGQLSSFIGTVAIGILLYQWIFMQAIYYFVTWKNPFSFYLKVLPAALTGFSADSSSAAMPVTLQCLDEGAKINPRVTHFVVPIGVVVNMDGTALFVTISSIFIAQMNGILLNFGSYVTICIMATAVSIATAAAPSASITLMGIILTTINAPLKDLGLLFAVDWLVDRMRTTNNVLGDCYAAAIVDYMTEAPPEAEQVDKRSTKTKC